MRIQKYSKGISRNIIIFKLSFVLTSNRFNSIILLVLQYSLHPCFKHSSPYVLQIIQNFFLVEREGKVSRSFMHGKKMVELDDAQYFTIVFRRKKKEKCVYVYICVYTRMKYSSWQALTHIESHGWVEQFEPPMFSDDGDTFLTILPKRQHDGSYWRHAVAITNVSSSTPRKTALTSGRFVVTEIVSWDQKKSYL